MAVRQNQAAQVKQSVPSMLSRVLRQYRMPILMASVIVGRTWLLLLGQLL